MRFEAFQVHRKELLQLNRRLKFSSRLSLSFIYIATKSKMNENLLDSQENEDEVHPLPKINVLQMSDESGMQFNSLRANTVAPTSTDANNQAMQYLTGTFDPKDKSAMYAFGNVSESQRGGNAPSFRQSRANLKDGSFQESRGSVQMQIRQGKSYYRPVSFNQDSFEIKQSMDKTDQIIKNIFANSRDASKSLTRTTKSFRNDSKSTQPRNESKTSNMTKEQVAAEQQTLKEDYEIDRQNLITDNDGKDNHNPQQILSQSRESSYVHLQKPGHKKRQAFKDSLILGPIDKYVKYGIFPYKFIVHIALMFLTMWQVLLQVTPQTDYEAQTILTLNQLFLSTDPESFQPPEIGEIVYIYNIDEFREFVTRSIETYQDLPNSQNSLLEIIEPIKNATNEFEPIQMYYFSTTDNSKYTYTNYTIYNITGHNLGPFQDISDADLKQEIYNSDSMSLNFKIRQYVNPQAPAQGVCYREHVEQLYNFQKRGVIEVSLVIKRNMCDSVTDPFPFQEQNGTQNADDDLAGNRYDFNLLHKDSNLEPDELALYIMIIILAMTQFLLIVRYFFRLQIYFDRLQTQIQQQVEAQIENEDRLVPSSMATDKQKKNPGLLQSNDKKSQKSAELKLGEAVKRKGTLADGANSSQKNPNDSQILQQSDALKKGYMRLERRNTRFKLETINLSDFTESYGTQGKPNLKESYQYSDSQHKAFNGNEKESKRDSEKFVGKSDNFIEEVLSNNKTDPLYKSRKKSYYRSKSVEGDKDQISPDQLKLNTKQDSDLRKQSSRNIKKSKPRTQQTAVGGGAPPGGEPSSSSSSGSSSLTSSVYSSTISSHLSGDEQMEKHHITDVFADKDDNTTNEPRTNPVPSAISERESESSTILGVQDRNGQQDNNLDQPLDVANEHYGHGRRSQSVNELQTSSRILRQQAMAQQRVVNQERQPLLEQNEDDQDNSSESSFSLESLSDRSDLAPEDVERLVRRYYQRRTQTWSSLSFWDKLKLFKAWYLVSLTGNLCTIFGTLFTIFQSYFTLGIAELFVGFGAFCTWCSIVKYLANTEDYYVIARTYKQAFPLIARVWIGILPIYIGLNFLCMSVLWSFEDSFGNFNSGLYTMFSVQAGDALFDTFVSIKEVSLLYAILFMYCFLFFVVSIVQNIFMAIVEDSYISIKYAKNFDWLNSGIPPDEATGGPQPGNKGPGGDGHGGDQPRPPPGDQAIIASAANLSTTLPENFKKHLTQIGVQPEQLALMQSNDKDKKAADMAENVSTSPPQSSSPQDQKIKNLKTATQHVSIGSELAAYAANVSGTNQFKHHSANISDNSAPNGLKHSRRLSTNNGRDIIRELIDEEHEKKEEIRYSNRRISLSPKDNRSQKRRGSFISEGGSIHSQEQGTSNQNAISPFFGLHQQQTFTKAADDQQNDFENKSSKSSNSKGGSSGKHLRRSRTFQIFHAASANQKLENQSDNMIVQNKKKYKKKAHKRSVKSSSESATKSRSLTHDKSKKYKSGKGPKSQTTFTSLNKIKNFKSKTGQELKKEIVDLSKTKKRKEFEHDNKIQQKFQSLVSYSQINAYQAKQSRKVGKKIIGEIEAQIAQLLELRQTLHTITKEKQNQVSDPQQQTQQISSFLIDSKPSLPSFAVPSSTAFEQADDKQVE